MTASPAPDTLSRTRNFAKFYRAKALPILQSIEKQRKRIRTNYIVIGSVILGGFIIEAITWMLIGILLLTGFIVAYIRFFWIDRDSWERQSRESLFSVILTEFGFEHVEYSRYLPLSDLLETGLLANPANTGRMLYDGDFRSQSTDSGIHSEVSQVYWTATEENGQGEFKEGSLLSGLVWKSWSDRYLLAECCLSIGDDIGSPVPAQPWKRLENQSKEGLLKISENNFAQFDNVLPDSLRQQIRKYHIHSGKSIRVALLHSTLSIMITSSDRFPMSVRNSVLNEDESSSFYEDLCLAEAISAQVFGNISNLSSR